MSKTQIDEDDLHPQLIFSTFKRPKLRHDNGNEDEEGQGLFPVASTKILSHDNYTVGWICALPLEMAAAKAMLEEIHGDLKQRSNDDNAYILGRIGGHNVVIACLPLGMYGTTSATTVASQMLSSFKSICFWLMVGIGGGVPSEKDDIRLGDVIVSTPTKFGAVVQYDRGKTGRDGFEWVGTLNKPHPALLTAVAKLQANHELMSGRVLGRISNTFRKHPWMLEKHTYPGREQDLLFEAQYDHIGSDNICDSCDKRKLVQRSPRVNNNPVVHYGLVASGNQVMKHGRTRDELAQKFGILCFEMEAAGLMDQFSCLVVRGICDYADSHKNKLWQQYAAGVAAGYTKELLSVMSISRVTKTPADTAVIPIVTIERRRFFMGALYFDQIEARHNTIKKAYADTCTWVINKSEYRSWLDVRGLREHHGFLWLKGKPGAGKSTIMKYMLKHAKRTIKDSTIIWFFFNARGEDLEKSAEGMYRSLLLQLLNGVPKLQSVFDFLGSMTTWNSSDKYQWSIEILKELFENAIQILGQHQITCFIDALDECDEKDIRDMVAYFEHLGEQAVFHRVGFHVCFSSRHYPYVTIKKGITLILEGQKEHNQDISSYLYSELKIGHTRLAEEIRGELLNRAAGVFMWVVLVVDILNTEYDRGRIHALRQKLRDIPADLYALFTNILTRDHHNKQELLLSIQWVLLSKRPLKLEELYFAILSGIEPEAAGQWCPEEITTEIMRRFILDCSKGLVEATKSSTPRVQFIHESVRDFLLKENGLYNIWPDYGSNFQGRTHDRLKQCCFNYMTTDIANHVTMNNHPPKTSSQVASSLRQLTNNKFPFLDYAINNVLFHAEVAGVSKIPQADFIRDFPLLHWIDLYNVFEKHDVRRYTRKANLLYILAEHNMSSLIESLIRIDPSRDPLIDEGEERYGTPILAALATGSEDAVSTILRLEVDQHVTSSDLYDLYIRYHQYQNKQTRYGRDLKHRKNKTILSYAAENNDITLLHFLLKTGKFNPDSKDKDGCTALSLVAEQGHGAAAQILLNQGVDPDLKDNYGRTPLYWAAQSGHEAIVKLLLSTGKVDPNIQDKAGHSLLYQAVRNGHDTIVELLLSTGKVDPNIRDKTTGCTPLHEALRNGYDAISKLLLLTGRVDPNIRDKNGLTPLHEVARNGHDAIAKLLLSTRKVDPDTQEKAGHGPLHRAATQIERHVLIESLTRKVDPNARDKIGLTPLHEAAYNGHATVVGTLLLTEKIDPNMQNKAGYTPLHGAARFGHDTIVRLLLSTGKVDPDTRDTNGLTPLHEAAWNGHDIVAKLLLSTEKVNPDTQDKAGHSPLYKAAQNGHKAIVELLLSTGKADPSIRDKITGCTLFHVIALNGHHAIAELLLSTGKIDPNLRNKNGFTPLYVAARNGSAAMVEWLLSTGKVNPNTRGENGLTPLHLAAENGHDAIVKLLLSSGVVDTNARDDNGLTPLHGAARKGYEAIAELLLSTGKADPNARDAIGLTPLHFATSHGHEIIIQLLLSPSNP